MTTTRRRTPPRAAAPSLPALPAADPQLARDAAELQQALEELIRVYQFRDRDRICCHDISVSQCYALDALVQRGPLTLNDLAAHLYLDKSTASRIVDGLERKGLARRSAHPADGRAVLLSATRAGTRLRERIRDELLADQMRLLADFEPEVRRAMAQLIGRLASAAAARVEAGGGSCCRLD
ncbi:MAG TPA: MarR family transcriptional regulator [Longimicrobiales bacterium]